MTCCGRTQAQPSCGSNANGGGFGNVRNGGIGGYDTCPGTPCCMPTFRPPCPQQAPSYGPVCIPLPYPCPCQPCPRPTCGQNNQNAWPRPGQCCQEGGREIQLNFNNNNNISGGSIAGSSWLSRPGCPVLHSQPNCPPRCGPCGRRNHSSYDGCPDYRKDNCEVRSPCPRPQLPYSDGCLPPPCNPCCALPCCNPLPPCCIAIRPCLPKCCPSLACKKPPYCCPNPCAPQPDPRCCPKPMILSMMCPQRAVPSCVKQPCSY